MTLFKRVLIPVLGVSVLGLLVSSLLLCQATDETVRAAKMAMGDSVAVEVMRGLDIVISQVRRQVDTLVASPEIIHLLDPNWNSSQAEVSRVQEHLVYAVQALESVDLLTVIDTTGRIVSSSNPLARGTNRSDRLYFQEAMQGKAAAEGPLTARSSGKPVFSLAVPVKLEDGTVGGVVMAALGLEYLNRALVDPVEIKRRGNMYVLSTSGQVIMHPSRGDVLNIDWFTPAQLAEMKERGSGILERVTATGTPMRSTYITLPYPGWLVIFEDNPGPMQRIVKLRDTGLFTSGLSVLALIGVLLPLLCPLLRDLHLTAAFATSRVADSRQRSNRSPRHDDPPNEAQGKMTEDAKANLDKIAQRRDELGDLAGALTLLANELAEKQITADLLKLEAGRTRDDVAALSGCVDNLGGGVAAIRLNRDCSLLWGSPGFYAMRGYAHSESTAGFAQFARHPFSIVHPDDMTYLEDALTTASRKQTFITATYRIRLRNGASKRLKMSGQSINRDDSSPVFLAIFFEDTDFSKIPQKKYAG